VREVPKEKKEDYVSSIRMKGRREEGRAWKLASIIDDEVKRAWGEVPLGKREGQPRGQVKGLEKKARQRDESPYKRKVGRDLSVR